MTISRLVICSFIFFTAQLFSADFTIASYNAGGLTDHYDYLRAAAMQKVMQERYNLEPEQMAMIERIQNLALKINFSKDPEEKSLAQQEWNKKNYQALLDLFRNSIYLLKCFFLANLSLNFSSI